MSTYSDGPNGRRHDALTVNSLTKVSTSPPLVSLCLRHDADFLADLVSTKVWAVSILDSGAADIARTFTQDRTHRAVSMHTLSAAPGGHTGALVLDSPSWLECELRDHLTIGDHVIVVGEVMALGVQERRPPLIFLRGGFHALEGV